jgi:hypothetical protein
MQVQAVLTQHAAAYTLYHLERPASVIRQEVVTPLSQSPFLAKDYGGEQCVVRWQHLPRVSLWARRTLAQWLVARNATGRSRNRGVAGQVAKV